MPRAVITHGHGDHARPGHRNAVATPETPAIMRAHFQGMTDTSISTNLSLELSDGFHRQVVTSGLGMISVSLDGATQETYSQYRRGGDFDLVVRNMRRLVELKRERGLLYPLIEWRFLRFQHNEHEEQAAKSLADDIGADPLEFWPGSAPPVGSLREAGVYRCSGPLVGRAISSPALTTPASRQRATGAPSRTVCQKCPQPRAQHYQFRMKLRTILRNAPDWAVRILAKEPEAYFLPEDKILVPEVAALMTLDRWAHSRRFWNIDWRNWRASA